MISKSSSCFIMDLTNRELLQSPSRKRKRVGERTEVSKNSSSLSETEIVATKKDVSPVEFLRLLIPSAEDPPQSGASLFPFSGQAPSMEELKNYDMESVTAIRAMDVAHLRHLLTNEGKSFHACNRNGESLLHLACRRSNVDTVNFLVHEANVATNAVDDLGRTILHDAVWKSFADVELLKALLPTISPRLLLQKDQRGHTAFDYARRQHWTVWTEFLESHKDFIVRRLSMEVEPGTIVG
jgi:ankyrin repeat protein